jgi:hypothetical protein
MKTELTKIKALIDSHEELIDGIRVYADIDVWSEAKEAYESLFKESDSLPCVRLSFDELSDAIIKYKAKSEYQQASIVILRKIFEAHKA